MTQPGLPTAPTPDTLALEHAAARAVTAGLRRQLEWAAQQITALYVGLAGGTDNPLPEHLRRVFADAAAAIIARVQFTEQQRLWDLVRQALALGARDAAVAGAASALTRPEVEDWIGQIVGTVADRVLAQLTAAKAHPQIGAPPATYRDILITIALANRALGIVERDTRTAINGARNQGLLEAVNEAGVPRVWVAEADACLHCLAYSGEVAQPYRPYPSGLTFYIDPNGDPKPLKTVGFVWGPPLHPNCRCSQEPYLGSLDYPVMPWEQAETTVSDALKREARRVVALGRSGTDSQPARLRAASALLARGAGLPKSVQARARAAVRAGAFR